MSSYTGLMINKLSLKGSSTISTNSVMNTLTLEKMNRPKRSFTRELTPWQMSFGKSLKTGRTKLMKKGQRLRRVGGLNTSLSC